MSNFACEHCGAIISDSPRGYVTGCVHYPADAAHELLKREPVRAGIPRDSLCRTCAKVLSPGKCEEEKRQRVNEKGYTVTEWCNGYELAG